MITYINHASLQLYVHRLQLFTLWYTYVRTCWCFINVISTHCVALNMNKFNIIYWINSMYHCKWRIVIIRTRTVFNVLVSAYSYSQENNNCELVCCNETLSSSFLELLYSIAFSAASKLWRSALSSLAESSLFSAILVMSVRRGTMLKNVRSTSGRLLHGIR